MKKIEINSRNIHRILDLIIANKQLFLVFFFGGLLVYSFDVVYQNAYLKIEYVDYTNSGAIFDGRRENALISKITDNLKMKGEVIDSGLNEEHINIFIYKDDQEAIPGGGIEPGAANNVINNRSAESIPSESGAIESDGADLAQPTDDSSADSGTE